MIPLGALPLALCLAAAPGPEPVACAGETPGERTRCEAVAARPRLPLPSAADRAALGAVYARPELRRARSDPAALRRLVARLWFRLVELLGSAEAERYASVGRTIFVVAAGMTGLAALAAARRRRALARPAAGAPGAERAPLPPPDRSAALATDALARGDAPGAVRHAFLSALAALEEAGRLPRDRTLTNGELASRLATTGGGLGAEFAGLARAFDGVIYGGLPVTSAEAGAAVAGALRIREAAEAAG